MRNCYIDGVSCWDVYGVWIEKGGYNDLLAFPALKIPEQNAWPEEDGVEADLAAPRLEAKEVSIRFVSSRPGMDADNFIHFVSGEGYHTLYVPTLMRSWNVRLVSEPARKTYKGATAFTLRFVQDIPLKPEAVANPGLPVRASVYEIDGVSLDHYGIVVEQAKDNVLGSPVAKKNLSREIKTLDGRIYDADFLVFESKEVAFKCYLKAISMEHFHACYDAFFYGITRPGERELYVDYVAEFYPCHYKSTSGWKLHLAGGFVLVEFTLVLVFTSFRVDKTEYLLASERGDYIVLEEDIETFIDMQFYGD
jgi:hypothetical protein